MEDSAGYEERFSIGIEDVASYLDFFDPDNPGDDENEFPEVPPRKTALPEADAQRMAEALDDYELVSVVDIGGRGEHGFWIVVRDHRFGLDYEIASHCDYWDFIAALVDHKQYIGRVVVSEVA